MATNHCPSPVLHCPCENNPFGNLSAEKPDPASFFSFQFVRTAVPLGALNSWWGTTVAVDSCDSVISQQDANDCALRRGTNDILSTETDPSGNPIPIFGNAPQSCQLDCGTGFQPFVYTVPAGTVIARSQAEADAIAASYCFQRAQQARVCVPVVNPVDPNKPTVDPLEWWTFDETIPANGAIHATGMNLGASIAVGKIGNGIRMVDGQFYQVNAFPNSINGVNSSTFNVTLWAKWNDYSIIENGVFNLASVSLFDNAGGSAGGMLFRWFSSTQRFQLRIFDEFGFFQVTQNFPAGSFLPVIGQWYMFTVCYDVGTGKGTIYVAGGSTFVTTGNYSLTVPPTSAIVNGVFNGGVPTFAGDIVIDELAFWNYNLSTLNQTFLYNANAGRTWPY